jgi:ABC-type sugar transport system ATPase subunit
MAEIQLHNVSLDYSTPAREPVSRIFQIRRERNMEDLPTEVGKRILALDHVNLTIPDGQTFTIVGPSGCGKSTLLRVVSGITNNYSGQVLYDGADVQDVPPKDRYIGMVFQNYALYPNLDSEGNLSFFFRMHKVSDEKTRARIQYTSDLMGIGFEELLPRNPKTLSGGEKQRVAIARAIVRAPKLFLLDEPLSSLDAKLRLQTRSEIKRLLHQFGITSLYVTHDQSEAIALGDQIVIMHSGRIEQVGSYQDLMENPATEFVAGFLGLPPMNLLPSGSISGGKLVLSNYLIPLSSRVYPLVANGQSVTLGFRREAVKVSVEQSSGNGLQLRGEVEVLEPDYAQRTQTVYIRDGLWSYSGLCSLDMKLRVGQSIHAELDAERLYFFDGKTGLRL